MRKIIILVLLLGLSGCAFVYQNLGEGDYSNLSYGMSKDEVLEALGSPQSEKRMIIVDKEYDVWEYPVSKSGSAKLNQMGTSLHKVFFLDEKLVRWDKDKVFGQPSFEFQETQVPELGVPVEKVSGQEENLK